MIFRTHVPGLEQCLPSPSSPPLDWILRYSLVFLFQCSTTTLALTGHWDTASPCRDVPWSLGHQASAIISHQPSPHAAPRRGPSGHSPLLAPSLALSYPISQASFVSCRVVSRLSRRFTHHLHPARRAPHATHSLTLDFVDHLSSVSVVGRRDSLYTRTLTALRNRPDRLASAFRSS